jgi:hypothetical protein
MVTIFGKASLRGVPTFQAVDEVLELGDIHVFA